MIEPAARAAAASSGHDTGSSCAYSGIYENDARARRLDRLIMNQVGRSRVQVNGYVSAACQRKGPYGRGTTVVGLPKGDGRPIRSPGDSSFFRRSTAG